MHKLALITFEKNSESVSQASILHSGFPSPLDLPQSIIHSLKLIRFSGVSGKNKTLNDSYETYLGAKEITTKTEAENAYGKTREEYLKIV